VIVRVEVRGVVQGVGFRWFTREHARRLELAGWVRNRADGCVEVAASGSETAIAELLATLAKGPAGARVDRIVHLPLGELGALGSPFGMDR
jgi:acylphosphatase